MVLLSGLCKNLLLSSEIGGSIMDVPSVFLSQDISSDRRRDEIYFLSPLRLRRRVHKSTCYPLLYISTRETQYISIETLLFAFT